MQWYDAMRDLKINIKVLQVIVPKVFIFLVRSSNEDHLTISIGMLINSAYITLESSGPTKATRA